MLDKTVDPANWLDSLEVGQEIRDSYDKAVESRKLYASVFADFVFEHKEWFASLLE